MQATAKFTHMRREPEAAIRQWAAQKGAQGQDTPGRGCACYATQGIIIQGTTADWKQASALIDGFSSQHPLADRGYDSNAILCQAAAQGMVPVILPKKNRKEQREYDKELYKARHLIEKACLHLKRWRGIAARYAKHGASFLAAIHIRCIFLWTSLS